MRYEPASNKDNRAIDRTNLDTTSGARNYHFKPDSLPLVEGNPKEGV